MASEVGHHTINFGLPFPTPASLMELHVHKFLLPTSTFLDSSNASAKKGSDESSIP